MTKSSKNKSNRDVFGLSGTLSSAARIIFVLIAGAGYIFAQTAGSATIAGTVKDPGGSVIPAAAVVIHNIDTGIDRTIQTNASGAFTAAFLPPGPYEIDIA